MSDAAEEALRKSGSMKWLVSALVVAFLAIASACGDGDTSDQPCTDIPTGGCPLQYGVSCEDPSCLAVYRCNGDNTWTLDHTCPGNDGGPVIDASPIDASDSAVPRDAAIDAPPGANGGPGCDALESPDCPLAFALACPSGCCDCEDLFVCQNGGWNLWGSCSLDAGIVADP